MLTTDQIRQECLEQFAKLTRHAPSQLGDKFQCDLSEGDGSRVLVLQFGKRKAGAVLAKDDMVGTIEQFRDKHSARLARVLLDSKG